MYQVFVYGTLKSGEPNYGVMTNSSNGKATLIGKARTTKKWPLVIASKYNIPYLLYCEGEGYNVIGEVYEVDKAMLNFLDQFEGHPEYYVREEREVEFLDVPNSKMLCWMYFLKNYKPHMKEHPFLADYSSSGSHNLPYVTSDDITDPEDI